MIRIPSAPCAVLMVWSASVFAAPRPPPAPQPAPVCWEERAALLDEVARLNALLAATQAALAACSTDRATCDASLSACASQRAACEVERTALGSALATCDAGLAACDGDLATCDVDRSSCDASLSACDGELATCDERLAWCDGDRATCDAERVTCGADLGTCEGALVASTDALATCDAGRMSCAADLASCAAGRVTCNGSLASCVVQADACSDDLDACRTAHGASAHAGVTTMLVDTFERPNGSLAGTHPDDPATAIWSADLRQLAILSGAAVAQSDEPSKSSIAIGRLPLAGTRVRATFTQTSADRAAFNFRVNHDVDVDGDGEILVGFDTHTGLYINNNAVNDARVPVPALANDTTYYLEAAVDESGSSLRATIASTTWGSAGGHLLASVQRGGLTRTTGDNFSQQLTIAGTTIRVLSIAIEHVDGCAQPAPSHWADETGGDEPAKRERHAVVEDRARGVLVLFGGINGALGSTRYGDTWEWNGAHWAQRPIGGPGARFDHGMVYDRARSRIVLYGGGNQTELGDTWAYDGAAWSALNPANAPPRRMSMAIAYDAARDEVLIFGGSAPGNSDLDETWTFDGATWSQAFPAAAPSARRMAEMTFDDGRARGVLFGGWQAGALLNDTWEWDGATWTRIPTAHAPAARGDHAMEYDAASGLVVLHGGYGDGVFLDDLWVYDGVDWYEVATTGNVPTGRMRQTLTADTLRDELVMFGGCCDGVDNPWPAGTWVLR